MLITTVGGKSGLLELLDSVYDPSPPTSQEISKSSNEQKQETPFPERIEIDENNLQYVDDNHVGKGGPMKATVLRNGKKVVVEGGLDFGEAVFDASMGKRCIVRREALNTVRREPLLECTQR